MSEKMPVTDLLNESFTFGFQRFFTVLRCLLVPYIILIFGLIIVAVGLLDFDMISRLESDIMPEPESFEDVMAIVNSIFRGSWQSALGLFVLAATVLSLPLYGGIASIFRLVGLGEEPGGWFTLRLDGPMWRTFFAWLIIGILQYVFYGIGFLIAFSMNPEMFDFFQNLDRLDDDPTPLFGFMGGLFFAGFLALILMMFFFTKLAPFPAASACENRLMLVNSWSRTKGHFWTILGGYIMLVLALFFANMAFQILTSVLQGIFTAVSAMGGEALMGIMVLIVTIVVLVATIAFTVFTTGVQMAFPAVIYRRLWRD
ncbi:hypothetical protein [Parvularcula sp. IMCC14364]|uniref:hypothetical protein n=1 Tax=Parvularcula sp. IMCC14364 TaxID=3067902 RepID=UPI0027409AFA|nr:hypothetical protein [Parvularcula sp. IMCC14364]